MIAFRKSPLDTGMLVCRGCFQSRPLGDFEPRKDSVYGVRRRCRVCRRPQHERSERKRAEQRYAALESRIATAPEGPELDAYARELLDRGGLRLTRAVACRLKAGSYELDADGRPIIPPAVKCWADRLDFRQAESFCRRKLGLPRRPPQRRSPYPTFAEMARATLKRFRAEFRLKQRLLRSENRNWSHRPAADPLEHDPWPGDDLWPGELDERPAPASGSRTGRSWTYEDERRFKADAEYAARFHRLTDGAPDHPNQSRTLEEIEYERTMDIPPPAPLPLVDDGYSPTEPEPRPLPEGPVRNNPAIALPLPASARPATLFPQFWGPPPGSEADRAALKAAGLDPCRDIPPPAPTRPQPTGPPLSEGPVCNNPAIQLRLGQ